MKHYLYLFIYLFGTNLSTSIEASLNAEGISDGTLASENEFKYPILVRRNNLVRCGGAILAEFFINAAANCFIDISIGKFINDNFTVVASVIDINDIPESAVLDEIIVVYVPEEFRPIDKNAKETHRLQDDIAVGKLKNGLKLGQHSYLGILNTVSSVSYDGQTVTMTGYGLHRFNKGIPMKDGTNPRHYKYTQGRLRVAKIDILSSNNCRDYYDDFNPDKQICGRIKQRRNDYLNDICAGDNGSPLVYEGETLVGIVGYVPEKCRGEYRPAVFTKVEYYSQFIEDAKNNRNTDKMRVARWKKPLFSYQYQFLED